MKVIPYAVVFIVGAGLMFFLMKGCAKSNEDKLIQKINDQAKVIDSTTKKSLETHITDSVKANTFFELAAFWQDKYDSLHNSYKQTESKVITSAGKVKSLSDSVRYYRMVNDTLKQLTHIGDLLDEDSVLLDLLNTAKIQIDSLHSIHINEIAAKDSTILVLRSDATQLSFQLSDVHHEYDELVSTTTKELKKAKTNKFWTRVLAITTGIFAATTALKK